MSREFILYLTPTGPLADQCDAFFRVAGEQFGPTEAHTYPPHVTLTGFFRRSASRFDTVCAEIDSVLASVGEIPPDAVEVVDLLVADSWVGLVMESPWAKQLTADVVRSHQPLADEDALRPKDWLHLSLAYGLRADQNLSDYAALAHELVDIEAAVGWQVGLWERHPDGNWSAHARL